ncbi:HEAT repeat domain-containing protein [Pontiellaceae bacterium B12227]|nr:HEAT repeat domain-containing protein [Pontiellaceae bacterium B12227]
MKRRPFIYLTLLAAVAMLGLTGCSRTIDDVAKWKTSGNIEKLIKALADPKIEVRLAATEALGELKAEPAVNALAALYNDSEETIILASVESLAQIGTPSIVTPMTAALKLDYPQARLTAAGTLGELKAVGAVSQLVEALDDAEADVQLAAALSLGQIGDESGSEGLVGKLSDSSTKLRKTCAESLGQTGGETAAKGLIPALADENDGVGKAAKAALINIGDASIPFALEALKNDETKIRAGAIAVLRGLKTIPETGTNMIWYQLARASVDSKPGIDKGVVMTLASLDDSAFDTLLEAAAHNVRDFREHATYALERNGRKALSKALAYAEANAGSEAKAWMAKRGSWPGAPSWRIDLWASLASLNPEFNLDSATAASLEMQARPAFNIIVSPDFKAEREYIPMMIALLGDTTKPPPEEPDYNAEGIPVVKKKRDMFRGEANRLLAEEKLAAAEYLATLPLISAIEDEDELIAGNAADILGSQGEKRALNPLMKVVSDKLETGQVLTDSPFYVALQKMDEPAAEPLLLKIRPNPDRAMRVFERQYPGVRPMSAETKDSTGHASQPVTFRLGYIEGARVGELLVTFMVDGSGNWVPTPALPAQLPTR